HLLDFMCGYHNRAAAVEIVVQERVIELFAEKDIETERRLVENQELRIHSHDQRQMKLRDHAFRQLSNFAAVLDRRFRQKVFCLQAIKTWMHARQAVEELRNANPARQYCDVCNEAGFPHQLITLNPWIVSENV